jgi:Mrp family chromosome partitioning ATPase
MTKIIGIIQVKGGAGRSTLATNLAGELSTVDRTVIIDCGMLQCTSPVSVQSDIKAARRLTINPNEEIH